MTNKEILKYDGKILTSEEIDELWQDEKVVNLECNGMSGKHAQCMWYSVELKNGTEIDIYEE